jgi:hypothetical protein
MIFLSGPLEGVPAPRPDVSSTIVMHLSIAGSKRATSDQINTFKEIEIPLPVIPDTDHFVVAGFPFLKTPSGILVHQSLQKARLNLFFFGLQNAELIISEDYRLLMSHVFNLRHPENAEPGPE